MNFRLRWRRNDRDDRFRSSAWDHAEALLSKKPLLPSRAKEVFFLCLRRCRTVLSLHLPYLLSAGNISAARFK